MLDRQSRTTVGDQAHPLRRLVARSPTHVIAVTSGKGGVGKTQVAVNLSIALAARGHRVALFDMDLGLANADIVLGVEASSTWSDVLSGRRSLEEVLVQAPGQVAFVPGGTGLTRLANLSEFERHRLMAAMEQLERGFDVMVLDCGAGISRNVVGIAATADLILVVSTPEPTAVTDAYAMIKALTQEGTGRPGLPFGVSIGILVNQAESRREGIDTFERLAKVAAKFLHLPVTDYGYILRDDHVPSAVRQQCPVILRYPRCSASTCLMASAARLSPELGQPNTDKSLLYRVMNMFL